MPKRSLQQVLSSIHEAFGELEEMLSPFLGGTAPAATSARRRTVKRQAVAVEPEAKKPARRGRKGAGRRAPTRPAAGGASNGRALQGKYMGVTRSLTAAQKKEVRSIRDSQGVEAAIARAQELKQS